MFIQGCVSKALVPTVRFTSSIARIMSLTSNTAILSISQNETALGQQDLPCFYVNSTAEKISKVCAYCFLLLGSFLGNILIISIVYKHRDLRKTINYFIVNMAVSDLILSIVVIPVRIIRLVTGSRHWRITGILGSISCKSLHFLLPVSIHVSAQSLVWIAIDRFVAVVFPIKVGLISAKIRTTAIISTWIVSGLFNFPMMITMGLVQKQNNTYCTSNSNTVFLKEGSDAYAWLLTSFFAIAPLFIITMLYIAIAIALKRKSKALADTAPNMQRHSLKKRRQAIYMAFVIVVMFYICVIPYTFLHVHVSFFWTSCAFLRFIHFSALFMYYSSSIVNPIICLSFVQSFRRGLRNILCPCLKMKNREMAKREQITLKEMRNIPDEKCRQIYKDTENDEETLDTVL